MKVEKLYNIVKGTEKIGVIQQETYDNGIELYGVNTQSIGISFKTLVGAIQYIEKFGYKAATQKSNTRGYNLKNVKIFQLQELGDILESFQNIYESLLSYSVEKAYLNNIDYEYIDVEGVFDEALNLIKIEKEKQWLINSNVKSKKFTDEQVFEMVDIAYLSNKKVIEGKFKTVYRILDNGYNSLLLAQTY